MRSKSSKHLYVYYGGQQVSRQKDSTNTTKTTLLAQHKILKQRQQLRFDDNTLKSVTTKAFE